MGFLRAPAGTAGSAGGSAGGGAGGGGDHKISSNHQSSVFDSIRRFLFTYFVLAFNISCRSAL